MKSLKKLDAEDDESESSLFCRSIARRMEKLTPYQRHIAQIKICQVGLHDLTLNYA